jgi:hypothetical protein
MGEGTRYADGLLMHGGVRLGRDNHAEVRKGRSAQAQSEGKSRYNTRNIPKHIASLNVKPFRTAYDNLNCM